MCEIMTIIAAVIFTAVYLLGKKNGKTSRPVLFASLMFWGAAIMWAVDGIASVAEGEAFFDISMEDTLLGFLILASGLFLFAGSVLLEKRNAAKAS